MLPAAFVVEGEHSKTAPHMLARAGMRVSVGQCTTGEFCTSSPSVSACDRPKNVSLDLLTGASSAYGLRALA